MPPPENPTDPRVAPLLARLYTLWDAGRAAGPADVTADPALLPLLEAAVRAEQAAAAALGGGAVGPPRGVAGRLAVGELHGSGGMGAVYRAADADLGRVVAYKVIHPGLAADPRAAARFRREAELAAGLEHPGIVPVYSRLTDDDGRPAYVMRFVAGPELGVWAARCHADTPARPPTPAGWRPLLGVFVRLCGAIQHAHAAGVLHRDLTARNVLVDAAGTPVVIDWGLARRDRDPADSVAESPAPRPTGGTPGYTAPEVEAGGRHAVASDVYALGAVLRVVLTGAGPTAAGGRPPPRPLLAVWRRATCREPADRYPSAGELAADVERWLAGERVRADAEPWAETAARWAYRRRTPALVLAAGLIVAAAGGTLAAVREAGLRRAADRAADAARAAEAAAAAARDAAVADRLRADTATDEMVAQAETVGGLQGTLPAVRLLLDRGRQHLDRLAALAAADPARRDTAADAHLRAARIRFKLSQWAEAEADCRAACDLTGPGSPPALRAAVLHQLGVVLAVRGRAGDAAPLWDAAADLLSARPDPDRRGRLVLAKVHLARGNVALFAADLAAAEGQYDRAAAAAGAVLAADPGDADARFLAAEVESNRGAARLRLAPADPDRALAAHRVALAHRTELVERFPANPDYKAYLAATHNHMGNTLTSRGGDDLPAAVGAYTACLQLLEPLAVAFPGVPSHRQEIGQALHNLGVAFAALGQSADAVRAGRRAVELLDGLARLTPEAADFHTELGVVGQTLARTLRAAGHPADADELDYRAAVAYAVAARATPDPAERAAAEGRALAALATLRDLGYLSAAGRSRVGRETAFDGLRARPEFKQLTGGPEE